MSDINLFMESAPDAMALVAQDGTIAYANAQAERLFGYEHGAMATMSVDTLLPPRFRPNHAGVRAGYFAQMRNRMMGEGRPLLALRTDGDEFPVEISLSPLDTGNGMMVLAAIRDISDRKKAELALLNAERQFRTLVNGITEYAVLLLDTQGNIATWNAGAQHIKGYAADEVLGRHISMFYTEADQNSWRAQAALKIAETHGRFENEDWRVRKNGEAFLAHIVIDAIRNDDGALIGFAKIVRDVTKLKEAEKIAQEALRQRQLLEERQRSAEVYRRLSETLTAILDASPAGVVTVDASGVIESWNKAAEKIYRLAAASLIGRHQSAVFNNKSGGRNEAAKAIFARSDLSRTIEDAQISHARGDGSTVELSVSRAPLLRAEGTANGIVYVINDVTHTKALAEQLRHSQKLDAIGQMTGGVAHDFNNLLSIIICNLELLQEDLTPGSESHELCNSAMEAGLRGAELIQHMLAFSRKQALTPKLLEVNDVITDLAKLLKRTLGEHIEIMLNTAPQTCPVLIDPVQLQAALTNLATNARDAMPHGGRLVFKTSHITIDDSYTSQFDNVTPGEYVLISVTDSGSGMTPEVIEKAFDPFFTTKRVGQGTGLGLSMVFGFVKQSGGQIRIYSELGHGTTIKLYLPCAEREAPAPLPEPVIRPSKASNNETILVVEDNTALAKSVKSLLADAGYIVVTAENGNEALEALEHNRRVDLLFTDIVMPGGMNGIELARRAVQIYPKLKILFTSGFADALLDPRDSEMTTNRLLSKPYRRTELILKIKEILEDVPGKAY
jgi:PAS domain S-box-containing protein